MSEGRDRGVVDALTAAIESVAGTRLLHRDVGRDANRTVFTMVGDPASVGLSAKRLAAACVELIDLRGYRGTHPYVGALDVCPFVALWGLPPERAADTALEVARYVGTELGVPTYLYEHSATRPAYRSLAAVRRGGLAAVARRAGGPDGALGDGPDFGPAGLHPTAGACVVGARGLLVAFNVNLSPGAPVALAREIAAAVRSAGARAVRPHRLPKLRAIGWYQEAFGCAQVSCNLLDYRVTGLGETYLAVRRLAHAAGYDVAGSELIGMVPAAALVAAQVAFGEATLNVEAAARRGAELLGLGAVRPFVFEERVLGGWPPV